tara:strand:- start:476 stop:841 length:366 start_codon:yes stop_codon:yes gene_type:complete
MKAYSTIVALALVTATGSFAPAFARPFLYVSGFSYSGSGEACLKGAQKALEAADFKRDIKTDKFDGDAAEQGGFVYGYLKKNPIVATIECDAGEGITTLGVSGLNDELTFKKYQELYDSEW